MVFEAGASPSDFAFSKTSQADKTKNDQVAAILPIPNQTLDKVKELEMQISHLEENLRATKRALMGGNPDLAKNIKIWEDQLQFKYQKLHHFRQKLKNENLN
ncbi:MAG: hypothetical protein NTW50_00150 [Candidatus Berkelbacteria bacterium]|nr:hypothetical protein [Candidatus Berkelbacteria bacterium]